MFRILALTLDYALKHSAVRQPGPLTAGQTWCRVSRRNSDDLQTIFLFIFY
jgi:hypothetical protein